MRYVDESIVVHLANGDRVRFGPYEKPPSLISSPVCASVDHGSLHVLRRSEIDTIVLAIFAAGQWTHVSYERKEPA